MTSLLYLIPEVFNEKIASDNKLSNEKKSKLQFDDFFFRFMESKFKMKKLINKHIVVFPNPGNDFEFTSDITLSKLLIYK